VQKYRFVFICFLLLFLNVFDAFSQDRRGRRLPEQRVTAPDTVINPNLLPMPAWPDSIPIPGPDTIPAPADTATVVPRGDIQTQIDYYAEDSIVTDFTSNKVYLYNDAWFEYGNIRLEADFIIIDWEKSELFASGITDSLGAIQGNPVFQEGGATYEIRKEMRYNFKSQKAIISDVVTEQDEGFLRGQTVKKDDDGSVYLSEGFYTTCNLAEPHWHIASGKIKSIRGEHVISGPFNLHFNNIPTPLGLPFGIIPDKQEIERWLDRLFQVQQRYTVNLKRYADAIANPDPEKVRRFIEEPNFYDRDDSIIRIARQLQRGDDAETPVDEIVEQPARSHYAQALRNGFRYLSAASDFFERKITLDELTTKLDIGQMGRDGKPV
jgi:hypothetical protein